MAKRIVLTGLIVGLALLCVLGTAQAATVNNVAVINDESPIADHFYKEFQRPVTSDDATDKVGFFARAKAETGKRCLFKVNTAGTGSAVACIGDASPDEGRKYNDLRDYSINASGTMAWASNLSGGRNAVFKGDPEVVSRLGDPVPGGGLLDGFSKTAINDDGDVFFLGGISGVVSTEDQGIFRCPASADGGTGNCHDDTGDLDLLVQKNDTVPGGGGREFCSFGALAASNFGIAFRASTKVDCSDAGEVAKAGVFRRSNAGTLKRLALVGDSANPFPDVGGTTYGEITGGPSIENDGIVAFGSTVNGIVGGENLYRCSSTACTTPVAAAVERGQGDGCDGQFENFSAPSLSDAGDMAFSATSNGQIRGVYIKRFATTDLDVVACNKNSPSATPVPDVIDGEFTSFGDPSMSTGGKVGFKAGFKQPVSPQTSSGIFVFE